MLLETFSRIYASFAEFERDELRRRGVEVPEVAEPPHAVIEVPVEPSALAVIPAAIAEVAPQRSAKARVRSPASYSITGVSLAELRAEGVLEIGRAVGTSVLFVRTRVKIHLLHATSLPDRELDDYAVQLAVTWIDDHGLPGHEVARNLGVGEVSLRKALARAGYERTLAWRYAPRASRGRGGRGNRSGGRLVLARDAAWQAQ